MKRLNVVGFAVGFGAMWSVAMLYIVWGGTLDAGTGFVVEFLEPLYPGVETSFLGGFAGAFWGFMDGAIQGTILATVYNVVADVDEVDVDATTARASPTE